jgi:UrcA family protein
MLAHRPYRDRGYSVKFVAATTATMITMAVFAAISVPSRAADMETRTTVVHYDDLDLRTRAGAATLERRIAGAVESVCRKPANRSLTEIAREASCRQAAVAEAQPKLQNALATVGRRTQFASIGVSM